MKQVLLMAVLAAGMLLTGCSKDSEETVNGDVEKQELLSNMKEHIVGTWKHDGDFLCVDIKEFSGSIKDGIILGCTSEFGDYWPSTLKFQKDGHFELEATGLKKYTGTYSISTSEMTGEPVIWQKFDGNPSETRLNNFRYHEVFFETDYNTVYLVARPGFTIVSRYRKE